ncbi:uncharacterized protein PHACADRAFT_184105 [Phanerochaete carnosa HHB-10118-sp]|uniref:tRNA(Ile)-lysidine synthetase n=1 Tax=Phanerochaete carnosa (strain HHB-10118-sp) TaxID=650164 RepID=K5WXV5_PHACS|nr:uncharacterized protein PHACADRAFT_184105 [Phanerochaete carnosa HHB-10118-sp]EKM55292.1 hypothetical protein PHACADRAFT_184105 [Phanerochaete carnosa HHB-10118-sp]
MPSWRDIPLRSLRRVTTVTPAKNWKKIAPAPITTGEFYEHLQKCMPPTGWSDRIVVANSGGPDSVCLLHLLSAVVKQRGGGSLAPEQSAFPSDVYSVHVNHNLQAANAAMQDVAQRTAQRLGVDHRTETIPWGTRPFPPRPKAGQPLEELARDARGAYLFATMEVLNARCIAYAHHADDQVETAIMRLSKQSQIWGAAGMQRVRRWGMGSLRDISPAGPAGMLHWIVRPLLDVSKDRILATCEANDLEYVVDPTNFQPDITLRNSIRAYLQEKERHHALGIDAAFEPHWLKTSEIESYEQAIQRLAPGALRLSDLREATRQLGQNVERLELQVVLSHDQLLRVVDPDVRRAMIRRILRYVSPKPWGTLAAIGHADRAKLERINEKLWEDPDPIKSQFSLGSEVLWTPAVLNRCRKLKLRAPKNSEEPVFWLIQRAPPTPADEAKLTVDLTAVLRDSMDQRIPYLYDNRFLLTFDMEWTGKSLLMSKVLKRGRVEIRPVPQQFYLPQVVWVRKGEEDRILGRYNRDWGGVPWIRARCVRVLTFL